MDVYDLAMYLIIANAVVGLVVLVRYLFETRKE